MYIPGMYIVLDLCSSVDSPIIMCSRAKDTLIARMVTEYVQKVHDGRIV